MATLKDDPFSTVDPPTNRIETPSTNTELYTGFQVENQSGNTLQDVHVWLPYVYASLPSPKGIIHEALTWDNSQQGWFTPNFIDANGHPTGESLLLTAKIITHPTDQADTPLAAGDVTTASGKAQYPLSSTDFLKKQDWPPETIRKTDMLPSTTVGDIAPHGKSNPFDIEFTAKWGGGEMNHPQRAGGWIASLVPISDPSGGSAASGTVIIG